jgi:hypothetical protein
MRKLLFTLCIIYLFFCSIVTHAEQEIDKETLYAVNQEIEEILASPEFDPWEVRETWKWKWQNEESQETVERAEGIVDKNLLSRITKTVVAVLPWFLISSLLVFIIVLIVMKKEQIKKLFGAPSSRREKQKTGYGEGKKREKTVLPRQIIGQAQYLWKDGKPKQALSLIYRGALSYFNSKMQIAIPASATEDEAFNQVSRCLHSRASYKNILSDFAGLIRAWLYSAYANRHPDNTIFNSLCHSWDKYFKDNM